MKINIFTGKNSINVNGQDYDGVQVSGGVAIRSGPSCFDNDVKVMYFEVAYPDDVKPEKPTQKVNHFVVIPSKDVGPMIDSDSDCANLLTLEVVDIPVEVEGDE